MTQIQGPEAKKECREDGHRYRKAGIGRTLLALMGRTNNTTWKVLCIPESRHESEDRIRAFITYSSGGAG